MTSHANNNTTPTAFNEKTSIITDNKRHAKPLPIKPLATIDDSSRIHVSKLLNNWLSDLNIPIKPWFNVLFNIALTWYEKAMNATRDDNNKTMWVQTFTYNSPMESKFLFNVFDGKRLVSHDDDISIDFPIGGTICIYGLNDETISTKIINLIQPLLYLTHSLYLESHVMRDSHVKLIISTNDGNQQQQGSSSSKSTTHLDKKSLGIFNWFKKLTPPPASIASKRKDAMKRGLSIGKIPQQQKKYFEFIKQDDPHRFYKLKQRIEYACISTSPECHFPYPALLNRLEIEQDDLLALTTNNNDNECLTPTTTRPNRRRSSLISNFSKRNSLPADNVQLPQSITAYSSIRPLTNLLVADSKKGLEHLMLDTNSLKSFKHHQSMTLGFTVYPIGCPDRPCLGPIMSKIDYFRYHAAPDKKNSTIFPSMDQTLGHTIRHWCSASQSSCQIHMDKQLQCVFGLAVETPPLPTDASSILTTPPSQCSKFHGCNQPLLDHVYSFAHGIGKINVYTRMEDCTMLADNNKITTWISCSLCDTSTTPILLNEKTDGFSFAKYLELVFYSSKLASPQPFCEHTKSHCISKNVILRCFYYHGVTVKLIYEDAKYYELRVPRIQMSSEEEEVPPLCIQPDGLLRININTLKDWKHKNATQDMQVFFQSVRTHLDLLNHYTKAEARRKMRGFPQQNDAKQVELDQQEIKALSKRLDTDYENLLFILADTHLNELNDFKRYFAIQSKLIIQYVSDWQMTKCKEVADTIGWDCPDYISSKTVHCFPGSSVLVREDEPTSFIAYTLSSNEYIQEILQDEGAAYSTSNKNMSMPSLSSVGSTISDKKPLQPPPNMIDGYYSSIERKYISPSTGASTETASFRTMMIEVVKSSVVEAQLHHTKRLEDLKAKLSPWSKKQEEALLEETDLKRQHTTTTLVATQQQEVKQVASYFYEDKIKKNIISPHIKHKFVYEGIEFTCIVYYAKEFETLRKRCDINQLIIQSLCRCQSWTTSGGKSKSHFYKTQDDRLVIKEMMNAWNVAEKDAFLKFAPKYFQHMKRSADEPSVLAKIFGFFTIRMKNTLDKKSTLLNLDVLVMEHLFFNQNIIRRFDFKGIQDRHVEEYRKQEKDATLWDGDWINEYRTRLPVYEQSKAIIELAISNDTEFLSKCNIMDYSLLVGIDQDKYEITVGIVGAYTWYKKLESKSKCISQKRQVTIVPPDQYKSRFSSQVCDYFIPVPGKFDLVTPSNILTSLLISSSSTCDSDI